MIVLVACIAAPIAALALACNRAPIGWQDDNGWHAGEQPSAARPQVRDQFAQFQHHRVLHGRDISASGAIPSSGNAGDFSPKSVEN